MTKKKKEMLIIEQLGIIKKVGNLQLMMYKYPEKRYYNQKEERVLLKEKRNALINTFFLNCRELNSLGFHVSVPKPLRLWQENIDSYRDLAYELINATLQEGDVATSLKFVVSW